MFWLRPTNKSKPLGLSIGRWYWKYFYNSTGGPTSGAQRIACTRKAKKPLLYYAEYTPAHVKDAPRLKQEPAREGVCCHDSAPRRPVLIRRKLCFAIGHESESEADGASRREEPLGPEVWVSGWVLSDEGPVHGERAWPTGGEEGGEEKEGSVGGTADRDPALGKLLRSHQELCGLAG